MARPKHPAPSKVAIWKRNERERRARRREDWAERQRIARIKKKNSHAKVTRSGAVQPDKRLTIEGAGFARRTVDFLGLAAAIRERRQSVGLTQLELDEAAGMQPGYTSHIEAPDAKHGRILGLKSLGPYLKALGLVLVVAEDPNGPPDHAALQVGERRKGPSHKPQSKRKKR